MTLILHTVGKRGNGRLLKCSDAAKRSLHMSHCSLPRQSSSLEVGHDSNMPPSLEKPFPEHSQDLQDNSSHWKASALQIPCGRNIPIILVCSLLHVQVRSQHHTQGSTQALSGNTVSPIMGSGNTGYSFCHRFGVPPSPAATHKNEECATTAREYRRKPQPSLHVWQPSRMISSAGPSQSVTCVLALLLGCQNRN